MPPRSFFEFGNVSIGIYVCLILIMTVMVYFIINIKKYTENNKLIEKINKACLLKCKTDTCKYILKKSTGSNYYMDGNISRKTCLTTSWELSHIIVHTFIGFFFNIHTSLSIGIIWELIEHYNPYMNCGNILDIFYNTLGYTIGWALQYTLKSR